MIKALAAFQNASQETFLACGRLIPSSNQAENTQIASAKASKDPSRASHIS